MTQVLPDLDPRVVEELEPQCEAQTKGTLTRCEKKAAFLVFLSCSNDCGQREVFICDEHLTDAQNKRLRCSHCLNWVQVLSQTRI